MKKKAALPDDITVTMYAVGWVCDREEYYPDPLKTGPFSIARTLEIARRNRIDPKQKVVKARVTIKRWRRDSQ